MHSTMSGGDGHPGATTPAATWPPPEQDAAGPGRVIGGVVALIAARLGLNPFWLRIAFVVLALAGGLGAVVYAGLWLMLVAGAGAGAGRRLVRVAGAALITVGTVYLLGNGRTGFLSGTPAVVALLVGLALALWQPRAAGAATAAGAWRRSTELVVAPPVRQRAPRRPPSMLGQATLGLAVVTAAVGALIDQANGGRLHPEEWLGVATAVCGGGLLVGIVRGKARWLILPAAVLAATGYVGGAAAERGIALQDRGHRSIDVGGTEADARTSVSFGDVDLAIFGVPSTPQTREIDVLVGDVHITVDSAADPSLDLHWDIAHGSATIDGAGQVRSGSTHIGPDRPADAVVHISIWRGDLTLWNQQSFAVDRSTGPVATTALGTGGTTVVPSPAGVSPVFVADGVTATADGYFLLANGEAMIDDEDHLVVGNSSIRADGVADISTSFGQFQLLPRGILLTPTNEVLDLHAWRTQVAQGTTTTADTYTTITGG